MNSSIVIPPSAQSTPWLALDSIPDLCAMPCAWQSYLRENYHVFRDRFLRPNPATAQLPADSCPLHFSWNDFGSALARAFGGRPMSSRDLAENTRQIGAWSCEATPMFLTCNADATKFELSIFKLCAAFSRPFIVIVPTKKFLNAECLACLDQKGSALFDLESQVTLTPSGVLQPTKVPGELFAAFSPKPQDSEYEAAARALEVVKRLDAKAGQRPPAPSIVFGLYCKDALSLSQVARRCRCSKATVHRRKEEIERIIKMPLERLRTYSHHLEKLNSAEEGKARRIHARSLIYDDSKAHPVIW